MPNFLEGEDEEPEDGSMTGVGDGDRVCDFESVRFDALE